MAEVKRYCLCGGAMTATGTDFLVGGVAGAFDGVHCGEGHGPATAAQARAARRKNDEAAWRQLEVDGG